MTSPARCPSLTIRLRREQTSSKLDSGLASHRKPALAFITMAANGWLTSCAIEAVIAPAVIWRLTCASSWRDALNCSSALEEFLKEKWCACAIWQALHPRKFAIRYDASAEKSPRRLFLSSWPVLRRLI
jgi:hypothetical protein